MQAGTLSAGQFGGLSLGEARTQLLELITGLRDSVSGGTSGTGGFNESRTITEVTGNRLAGLVGTGNTLQSTGNTYLAEIAKNTAPLVQSLPALMPPIMPAYGAGGGERVVFEAGAFVVQVSVTVPYAADAAAATSYGERLGGAIAEKLAYNAQRADHKPEARAAAGGKAY